MECDLLLTGGTIVDGTGRTPFRGDLAIKNGRIEAVLFSSDHSRSRIVPRKVINIRDRVVAPGFIDIHSHADFLLPFPEHAFDCTCLLEQGITTVVAGNCGFSPAPLAENDEYFKYIKDVSAFILGRKLKIVWNRMEDYFSRLEIQGVALNLAQLAGHGTMRYSLFGNNYDDPGDDGYGRMEALLEESFEAGAYGLSLGLGYEPGLYIGQREIEWLARFVQGKGGVLAVHPKALSVRSPFYGVGLFGRAHNLRALDELIELAENTGVRLQISHLLFAGRKTWNTADQALSMIEKARERGVDVAFDSFPLTAGNTTIAMLFPKWFLQDFQKNLDNPKALRRLKMEWWIGFKMVGLGFEDIQLMWGGHPSLDKYNGMFFPEIARAMGVPAREAYLEVTRRSRGAATCLFHTYSGDENNDEVLRRILAHPLNTFQTDAILNGKGAANPAAYGAFPRVLQRYQKELGLMTIEEAIAKMTGRSAVRMGINRRGLLKPGYWADVVVFNYDRIRDNATFQRTRQRPSGIRHVFINGRQVVTNGRADTRIKAGQVLRKNHSSRKLLAS